MTVDVVVTKVEGRRVTFEVRAHDGVDAICEGTHERFVIDRARFDRKLQERSPHRGHEPSWRGTYPAVISGAGSGAHPVPRG